MWAGDGVIDFTYFMRDLYVCTWISGDLSPYILVVIT
jgi:hypothetical protein